jgi:prolyl 4-hydroxylase
MKQILSSLPWIVLVEDFLTSNECDDLIKLGKEKLKQSEVVNTDTGISMPMDEYRVCKDCYFDNFENHIIPNFHWKLEQEIKIPKTRYEQLTLLNYSVGGHYVPHWDYFMESIPSYKTLTERAGNRIATSIVYLNDVEEGGATYFPKLDIRINPKKGSMLYFCYDFAREETLHTGEPVIKGEKYIVTTWIRERNW